MVARTFSPTRYPFRKLRKYGADFQYSTVSGALTLFRDAP